MRERTNYLFINIHFDYAEIQSFYVKNILQTYDINNDRRKKGNLKEK